MYYAITLQKGGAQAEAGALEVGQQQEGQGPVPGAQEGASQGHRLHKTRGHSY
jgi:hypothetical protein